jgi:polyisoprenoid-binding protein YceI
MKKIIKWIIIVLVAVVVITVAIIFIFPKSLAGPTAAPLQLPKLSTTTTNIASPEGTWVVGSGSLTGFRVNESFFTQSSVIVGRTNVITGSIVISNNRISSGSFQTDLSKLTMGGKPYPSLLQILNTNTYPDATFTLTSPIIFTNIQSKAMGSLTINGITHPVTFAFTSQYNGSVLEATGSAPILASDWNIKSPYGIHNNDTIEFLVVLQRK